MQWWNWKIYWFYWLNLRSYLQINNKEVNPAFLLHEILFDTKYDYVTVLTGYGSSQMRVSLVDLEQKRISLNSYRIGAGYFKQFGKSILLQNPNYDKSSGIYCK
jgi:hypothetical protein